MNENHKISLTREYIIRANKGRENESRKIAEEKQETAGSSLGRGYYSY